MAGLYLSPPEHALILSIDEKPSIRRWNELKDFTTHPLLLPAQSGRVLVQHPSAPCLERRQVYLAAAGAPGYRPNVVPEEPARGELREETGLTTGTMTRLGEFWIAYGVMRQRHHVFLAEELSVVEASRDAEEHDRVVHRVSVDEFEAMLLDGRCRITAPSQHGSFTWCGSGERAGAQPPASL